MEPAAIGIRLASSVVTPLVKKLFVTQGPGAGLVEKPVRISGFVSFRGEKRVLDEQDLEKLAAELVRRSLKTGERPIRPDDGGGAPSRRPGRSSWSCCPGRKDSAMRRRERWWSRRRWSGRRRRCRYWCGSGRMRPCPYVPNSRSPGTGSQRNGTASRSSAICMRTTSSFSAHSGEHLRSLGVTEDALWHTGLRGACTACVR